jgi:hypothetical protein
MKNLADGFRIAILLTATAMGCFAIGTIFVSLQPQLHESGANRQRLLG